jgi:hypothetical protein
MIEATLGFLHNNESKENLLHHEACQVFLVGFFGHRTA